MVPSNHVKHYLPQSPRSLYGEQKNISKSHNKISQEFTKNPRKKCQFEKMSEIEKIFGNNKVSQENVLFLGNYVISRKYRYFLNNGISSNICIFLHKAAVCKFSFSHSICIFLHKAAVCKFPFTHCWLKAETFFGEYAYDIRE